MNVSDGGVETIAPRTEFIDVAYRYVIQIIYLCGVNLG